MYNCLRDRAVSLLDGKRLEAASRHFYDFKMRLDYVIRVFLNCVGWRFFFPLPVVNIISDETKVLTRCEHRWQAPRGVINNNSDVGLGRSSVSMETAHNGFIVAAFDFLVRYVLIARPDETLRDDRIGHTDFVQVAVHPLDTKGHIAAVVNCEGRRKWL